MFKIPRRLIAAALACATLFSLSACSKTDEQTPDETTTGDSLSDQVVMTVNGHEVTAGQYAACYLYSKQYVASVMSQYGLTDLWNSEYAETYTEQLDEIAYNQIAAYYIIPEQFEAAGLSLSEDEREDYRATYTVLEDSFASVGFTSEMIDDLADNSLMQEKLEEYYFGEGGVMAPEDSEVDSYFEENYFRAKHVLISALDENYVATTDEAELAALEATAQEVYEKAIAGEDFDSLIAEYGGDPGAAAFPDGYVFTDGEMITEFQTAVEALGENEISEPVQSDYGWHIIQRLPLRDKDLTDVYSTIVTALTGLDMNTLLDQWINEAEITTEDAFAEITFDTVENYKYDAA